MCVEGFPYFSSRYKFGEKSFYPIDEVSKICTKNNLILIYNNLE
jgi:hypothetical protein